MIVTIDGPAGSGKSSAARALARRLDFGFLDTGAMYRAVAFAAIRDGTEAKDSPELRRWLASLNLIATPETLSLDGQDIRGLVRTPPITALASELAVLRPVREYLVDLQRKAAAGRSLVTEGRDQGTVVFPDAERKFFLNADRVERARRRHRELLERGVSIDLERVLVDQDERDRRDAERDLAPMRAAPDAIVLDSTGLTPEQVVDAMEREVRRCKP